MSHLETLDLRDTLVCALPKKLTLKALRHLLISNRKRVDSEQLKLNIVRLWRKCGESLRRLLTYANRKFGVKAPSNLGDLISLQKLSMIEVQRDGREEWLKKLGELTNLQKLGLSLPMLESADWGPLCSSIEKLTNLEALHLIGAEGQKIELSKRDKREAPEYLKRVQLTGRLEILPDWILPPDRLVKLVLKGSQLVKDPLPQLGEFSCLKHLELEEAFDVPKMKFDGGKFQKLCFLGLDKFCNLKFIQVSKEALPSLERLYLARCKSLTRVPKFITLRLEKFKRLEFCEMDKKFDDLVLQVKRNAKVGALMKADLGTWNGPTPVVDCVRGQGRPALVDDFNK